MKYTRMFFLIIAVNVSCCLQAGEDLREIQKKKYEETQRKEQEELEKQKKKEADEIFEKTVGKLNEIKGYLKNDKNYETFPLLSSYMKKESNS